MTRHIPAALLQLVRDRAAGVCEYCLLPQLAQEATFHIDHIVPRAAGGPALAENLALSCVTCSLKKAAQTHAHDPRSRESVPLFHPRRESWSDHFRWSRGWRLIGRTPTGRATIRALGINRHAILAVRRRLAVSGWVST
jgi:5-methylcytosine-specific restriction endonuclease McrA